MTNIKFQRANTLKAAFQVCNVEPLEGEEIERYYIFWNSPSTRRRK